jgi:hypothetical protein
MDATTRAARRCLSSDRRAVRGSPAVDVAEITTRLAGAVVHWSLFDEQGRPIYDFDASYTLADLGEGMRITAIAHNEALRLRAAIERRRLT